MIVMMNIGVNGIYIENVEFIILIGSDRFI
jgi:hypothetical protein